MRILKINGQTAVIDEKTAIGVEYQSPDIEAPGANKIKKSNDFSIPRVATNMALIGNFGDPQSVDTTVYDAMTVDYWSNNGHLIDNAQLKVKEVGDRIKLFAYEKASIWDVLSEVDWPTFETAFVDWLITDLGLPTSGTPAGDFAIEIAARAADTTGLILPMYYGNLLDFIPPQETVEIESNKFISEVPQICLFWQVTGGKAYNGGHFCTFVKKVFEYIEITYDVDFLTSDVVEVGNIWLDANVIDTYTPLKKIQLREGLQGFEYEVKAFPIYYDEENVKQSEDKTVMDFVNSFFQENHVIIDQLGEKKYRLAKFDDIKTLAPTENWSDRLDDSIPKIKPLIQGYAQNSYITFSDVYESGSEFLNSANITSNNKSLDISNTLFSIDAFINSEIDISIAPDDTVGNLSRREAFKTFSFFKTSSTTVSNVDVFQKDSEGVQDGVTTSLQLPIAGIPDLQEKYTVLNEMLDYPQFVEQKRWLTINDVQNLRYFKLYYITALNGWYFLNKISGFNPDKSSAPTKLELIRIPDVNRTIPNL